MSCLVALLAVAAPASAAPPSAAPQASIGQSAVLEGNSKTTTATFTVTLSKSSGQVVTVDYRTGDGSALSGADYFPANGTLTFNRKETTKTIVVPIVGDTDFEQDETYAVTLSNASGATIDDGIGEGAILNDDVSRFSLSVSKNGTGTGMVSSTPNGITCGLDCSESYLADTVVELTATPAGDSNFDGWSGGDCTGTGTCTVTMNQATAVTAMFDSPGLRLSVAKDGSGTGTVTSVPSGIDCGSDCSESYRQVTNVTLTATPDPGKSFAGWLGSGCSGTGTCAITVDASKAVKATFVIGSILSVTRLGQGSGTVTGDPAGIACGDDCTEVYSGGTVTLSAVTAAGSTFAGWSGGGCSGTGLCAVTMDDSKSISATFDLLDLRLTVSKDGTGTGTVVSSPAGINCGVDCSETYADVTTVTLTAVADPERSFAGWLGAGCSGTGTCIVTVDGAKTVKATFDLRPPTPADLRLVMSDDEFDDQLMVGDRLTYTLDVQNLGPGTAKGVKLVDRLPAELTFVATSNGCSIGVDGETVTCIAPSDLEPSATWSPTITATIDITDTVVNSASLSASTPDENTANNRDTEVTNALAFDSELVVVASGANPISGGIQKYGTLGQSTRLADGGRYRYTVGVRNDGPTRADGVSIELAPPYESGFTYPATAVTSDCSSPSDPIKLGGLRCEIGSIPSGGMVDVNFTFAFDQSVSKPNPQDQDWQATARAATTLRAASPNTTFSFQVVKRRYRMTADIVAPSSPRVGASTNIPIHVHNAGLWRTSSVVKLRVFLPQGLAYQGYTTGNNSSWLCLADPADSRVVVCDRGHINPETYAGELAINVVPLLPGTYWVTAQPDGGNGGEVPGEDAGESANFTATVA